MHGGSSRRKLNMHSALRRQVLRNMTTDLIKHGRLETTVPRAKELRRLVDKMITLGKRGTEHARHQIEAYLYQPKTVVPLLMNTYAKRFATRSGGFTRVLPIGNRKGDYAPMAMIEILNPDQPEAEVSFNYLVRSLASMQLNEEMKIVDSALKPTLDSNAVYADKRMFKRALQEHQSKERFALKVRKALKNTNMSTEELQNIVDAETNHVKELREMESKAPLQRFVKETWPENTPSLN
ncbi:54S ribosomal protein L8, mitochondrial [Coemansia sp. RSA 988]|nr:54S ribosomal protein L8, mitochondrial [Coemansia sp. RSA 988]